MSKSFPNIILGYSDHTQGILASSIAVAFCAKVFEKHFTLDKNLPGPDHWFSVDATGLKNWIDSIRTANIMLGSEEVKPTEIYHLGAQSYVDYSFKDEFSTLNTNINGTHYMLSAIKDFWL